MEKRVSGGRHHWPLTVSLLLLFGLLTWLMACTLQETGGHFGYPMDDTYIHMAMARSLSEHGVWGLTRYAFSSSSSSPLYTATLAASYALTGLHEITPFLLNVVLAVALLWWCDWALRQNNIRAEPRLLLLILITLAMPLPEMVFAGMEHVLHTLLTLQFAYFSVVLLTGNRGTKNSARWFLLCCTPFLMMARYEGVFLIVGAALLFCLRKQWKFAVALCVCGALPVIVFGMVSLHFGWYPVPVSLLAKANVATQFFGQRKHPFLQGLSLAARNPHMAALLLAAALLLYLLHRKDRSFWNPGALSVILFLWSTALHLQFARVGWFYRYEAYLVVFGIYACALAVRQLALPWIPAPLTKTYQYAYAAAALILGITLGARSLEAWEMTPVAVRNIYHQQYQMARFIQKYYPHDTVVLNDVGAVAYLSDAHILDYFGLGTLQVAQKKMARTFNTDFERRFAKENGAKLAIVYSFWYKQFGGLPPEWEEVGSWTIPDNEIANSDTVEIFAVDPANKDRLISALRSFRSELPAGIEQSGLYMENNSKR